MHVVAILAAGGLGVRLGADRPKQLLHLGGRTILERSLDPFLRLDRVGEIVVALPAALVATPPAGLAATRKPLRIVVGGASRQESVANAFDAAPAADVFVIHDAARPFVTPELIVRTIDAAVEHGAAVAALPAGDTIKEVAARTFRVKRTLDRGTIYLAQTPQAFRRAVLRDAIAAGRRGATGTDDAALVERAGHAVHVVQGDPLNMKITTEADLKLARSLMDGAPAAVLRVGLGYDLHRLVEGRPLVLGGVKIPFERGLAGHSDADVVCHATADAILGAVGAGDLGRLFPDSDPQWKDADSRTLLRQADVLARQAGFLVENLDIVIIAERPRILPYIDAMRAAMASTLSLDPARVGIKGKTNEGVGELGRGEAIAVHAVVLLRSSA